MKRIIILEPIVASVTMIVLFSLTQRVQKIHYFTMAGMLTIIVSMVLILVGDGIKTLISVCVVDGFGLGLFICTSSSLLLKTSRGKLGACAVGIPAVFRNVLQSIYSPAAQAIAKYN